MGITQYKGFDSLLGNACHEIAASVYAWTLFEKNQVILN